MAELTFHEASKLDVGQRVRFVRNYDVLSHQFPMIPSGATGEVAFNGLNEIDDVLQIVLDDDGLRQHFVNENDFAAVDIYGDESWFGAYIEPIEAEDSHA